MLPSRAVVDSSVAYKWLLWEDGSERANRLHDARLVAPELLDAECANVLWRRVRQNALSSDDARSAIARLVRTPVARIPHRELVEEALSIALELSHPAYDCLYLALAEREMIPLVTADHRLLTAARAHSSYAERVLPLASIPLE